MAAGTMLGMPLLLLDLDNTLLPRDAAFRAWAQDFLTERALPPGDVDWLVTIDGGGYVPRSTVLSAARRRYGLDESLDRLLAHYRRGINSHIHCPARNVDALRVARAAGWTLGIVSNGNTGAQLEKIRRTGLGPMVDGWVISEEADCLKPDPLIFEIAARRCGVAPTGDWTSDTWMIGDHAPADIAGAELAGLRSVWLHHGRPWAEPGYRPTLKAGGLPEAVGQVLAAIGAPSPRPAPRSGLRVGGAGMGAGTRCRPVGSVGIGIGIGGNGGVVAAGPAGSTVAPGAGGAVRPRERGLTAVPVAVAGRAAGGTQVPGGPGAGAAQSGPGPLAARPATAQGAVRDGAQLRPAAPGGGHAPPAVHAAGGAVTASGAGSAVRNRPDRFAEDAVGLPVPTERPGARPARTGFAVPPAHRPARAG
ncbi:HAD-IA family hydrolase [Kitasatospora sp. NPDC056327]|uniref:HAD-IA family hydrolase n=1 Tax=Kitasatospora sp. NPDC056327 TaxID=3345785 RepID=UPI0035E39C65